MSALLEVKRLTVHYPVRSGVFARVSAQVHAVDEVSFDIAKSGAMYPDHVVFLGPKPLVVSNAGRLDGMVKDYEDCYGFRPLHALVPGTGVLVSNVINKSALEMLKCQALVTSRLAKNIPINYLSLESVAELLDWDAEKYRQGIK